MYIYIYIYVYIYIYMCVPMQLVTHQQPPHLLVEEVLLGLATDTTHSPHQ